VRTYHDDMELSPKAITSVDFHLVRKGFDPDEVKAFLNQLAKGVEILQTQLSNADARARAAVAKMQQAAAAPAQEAAAQVPAPAVAAPAPAAPAAPVVAYAPQAPAADHETISRTLLLAQHTADATVQTAEERARQIVSDAEQHAAKLVTDGVAKRSELVGGAEAEARVAGARERARLEAEVLALAARRDDLHQRTQSLDAQIIEHRRRILDVAGTLRSLAEGPDGLGPATAGVVTAPSRPAAVAPETTAAPVSIPPVDDASEPVRSLWADEPGGPQGASGTGGAGGFFEQGARFGEGRGGPSR
jgi:DivIVA domain-containing protein